MCSFVNIPPPPLASLAHGARVWMRRGAEARLEADRVGDIPGVVHVGRAVVEDRHVRAGEDNLHAGEKKPE
eukprot:6200076-Pleurochrysis_carterae.AAC.9